MLQPREALLCDDCFAKTPNVCSECRQVTDVLIEGVKCPDCFYGQGWEETTDLRTRECVVCQHRTYVDDTGFCKNCYVNALVASHENGKIHRCVLCAKWTPSTQTYCTNCQKKARTCAECQEWFVPTHDNQVLCASHLPKCRGCEKKYVPLNRTDLYCTTCVTSMTRGECLKCGRPDPHGMDKFGHCHDCSTIRDEYSGSFEMGYPCIRCERNQVDDPRGICDECKYSEYVCPTCRVNRISYKDYICESCASNFSNSV